MATFTYTAPTVGGSADTWGTTLNTNWSNLSTFLGSLDSAELAVLDGITASTAELNILDGVTSTTAELNILDGVTATTAELNILDGVTATAAELNYVDGVTSSIQTQVDAKAANTTQATAVWETGTATTETIVSPANVKAAIVSLSPAGWGYTSAATTLSSNSVATFTHSLGAAPTSVEVDFVCSTANNGYVVGDRITGVGSQLQASTNRGFQILIQNGNTTEVKLITLGTLRFASATGSEVGLSFAQWDAVVKASL